MTTVMPRHREIEIVRDVERLGELRSEWDEVVPPGRAEPWQSFSWIEAAATSYSKHHQLRVMTVRNGGRLAAIAPLVVKPSEQPLRPLRIDFLGGEELKEPNGFVALDPASLDLLADRIASEPVYPVRLSRVPNDKDAMSMVVESSKEPAGLPRQSACRTRT
jgi:hypothetical protein